LLVTGAWREAKAYIEELEAMGHCVIFQQQESEPLACPAQEVEGVICNGLFLYHPIEKFTSLRYIQLTSAGYDRVPLDTIRERGIELHNAADVYSTPMAEFALGGVLQLYKRFDTFRSNQRQHHWEKQRNLLELSGKTVCIVGCGNVGKACAKRFAAFDTRVIGVTAHPRSIDWFEDICGLDELLDLPLSDNVCRAMRKYSILMFLSQRIPLSVISLYLADSIFATNSLVHFVAVLGTTLFISNLIIKAAERFEIMRWVY